MKPEDCICGGNNVHTAECKRQRRNKIKNEYTIKRRKELIENHKCLNCMKKVDPDRCPHCKKIIGYKRRCKKCLKKANGK